MPNNRWRESASASSHSVTLKVSIINNNPTNFEYASFKLLDAHQNVMHSDGIKKVRGFVDRQFFWIWETII